MLPRVTRVSAPVRDRGEFESSAMQREMSRFHKLKFEHQRKLKFEHQRYLEMDFQSVSPKCWSMLATSATRFFCTSFSPVVMRCVDF